MAILSINELSLIGFKRIGENIQISDKASFYGVENIEINDNVRIDDYCVISAGKGGIVIGSNVHVAVFCSMIGAKKIELLDFCNISSRVSIYSSSDDFSGQTLTNPTIPDKYKNVFSAPVMIGRHVVIGAGSIILPGANIQDGVAVGSLSLVKEPLEAWSIYAGVPAKKVKSRKKDLLKLEEEFKNDI